MPFKLHLLYQIKVVWVSSTEMRLCYDLRYTLVVFTSSSTRAKLFITPLLAAQ